MEPKAIEMKEETAASDKSSQPEEKLTVEIGQFSISSSLEFYKQMG